MAKAILYIIFTGIFSGIFGQAIQPDSIFEPRLRGEIFHIKTGMLGKQFYNDDWTSGSIKLNSGEWILNKMLKYNSYLDELIWLQDRSFRQIKLEKYFIEEFAFTSYLGKSVHFRKILFKPFQLSDSIETFVEVLSESPTKLYVFRSVVKEGQENEIKNGIQYTRDVLKPQPIYLLFMPDKTMYSFKKLRRRALIRVLNDKDKILIKEIIQKNRLTIRTEEDLKHLANLIGLSKL